MGRGAALLFACSLLTLGGMRPSGVASAATLRGGHPILPGTTTRSLARSPNNPVIHVVQRGETLTGIARKYGVTVAAIVEANDLADPNRIYAGQRLVIPVGPAADAQTMELAAIVYAEAQASPVDFEEMLAIASVVRNRVEHVAAHPADRRSFGGPGYHAVLSNRREFPSYGTPRYRSFLAGTIGPAVERVVAEHALRAAIQVRDRGAPYPFVFFQKAAWRPSSRAALPATRLGAHHFWSFRSECVDPLIRCRP